MNTPCEVFLLSSKVVWLSTPRFPFLICRVARQSLVWRGQTGLGMIFAKLPSRHRCVVSPRGDEVWKKVILKLPDPVICRARPACWAGTVLCLVHEPGSCKHVRYFHEVAYCTHPKREAIIARTAARDAQPSGGAD
jgi:hypothetical protein